MMDRIQHDWNTLKDEKEYRIIRCYTMTGMRYTKVCFGKMSETMSFVLNYNKTRHINTEIMETVISFLRNNVILFQL